MLETDSDAEIVVAVADAGSTVVSLASAAGATFLVVLDTASRVRAVRAAVSAVATGVAASTIGRVWSAVGTAARQLSDVVTDVVNAVLDTVQVFLNVSGGTVDVAMTVTGFNFRFVEQCLDLMELGIQNTQFLSHCNQASMLQRQHVNANGSCPHIRDAAKHGLVVGSVNIMVGFTQKRIGLQLDIECESLDVAPGISFGLGS